MAESGQEAGAGDERQRRMERAVKAWKDHLVDLGGRNTLLYYKDLKQGTLDLATDETSEGPVLSLLSGRTTRLSDVFDRDHLPAAAKRARTVSAKARENFEERGLHTLYLAWGMATWSTDSSAATPAAPILLCETTLSPRGGAGEDFDLSLGDEWELNPTLLHLLDAEYRVKIDAEELMAAFASDESPPDPRPVFDQLEKRARTVEDFQISERVVMGNLSYAKLPMVRDLETAFDDGVLTANDLLAAIAGDEQATVALRARHPNVTPDEPDHQPPSHEFLVLDADSSQSFAINTALKGGDLVVEGPPGTGKSQTIANLIATLAAHGKSILFVAEKRAAIDAVVERLHARDLGELVFDLHGGVSSRRRIAQDLAKALDTSRSTPLADHSATHERLQRRKEALRTWRDAVHAERSPWGANLYDVQAELLGLEDAPSLPRIPREVIKDLSGDTIGEAAVDLERFVELGGNTLADGTNQWAMAFQQRAVTSSEQVGALLDALEDAMPQIRRARRRMEDLADRAGLRRPRNLDDARQMITLLRGIEKLATEYDLALFEQAPSLVAALTPASRTAMHRAAASLGDATYRAAKQQLASLGQGARLSSRRSFEVASRAADLAGLWSTLSDARSSPQPVDLSGAPEALVGVGAQLDDLGRRVGDGYLADRALAELEDSLDSLIGDRTTLARLPELIEISRRLDAHGLWPQVAEIARFDLDPAAAVRALRRAWLEGVLSAIESGDPVVGGFERSGQDHAVADFRELDVAHIASTPQRVKRAVAERLIEAQDMHPEQAKLIHREASKKQRHLPLRTLVHDASEVLTALKPCWAMSPLLVAQVLPPERLFDVVIFDEASQVMPADAVGALLRTDRAIVAGDSKQLPPTSFFASSTADSDDEEETESEAAGSTGVELTRDIESVLDVMRALLPPPLGTKTLEWHYRSRDERLIAFSNAQPSLYDWSLTTFPGAGAEPCLRHELVPWVPGRVGQEQSVSDEVERVVELIVEHAEHRPQESLGVIAMGIKHANRITERLRQVRIERPDLDAMFETGPSGLDRPEPLFIKNLERVQGDERDSIILTIGYGKNADGRMVYRFGPLNQEGGERRLNVAITRARHRMTVVSSFGSVDLDPGRMRAEGAQMLHRYLQYAETAGANLGDHAHPKPELNPFERDVQEALTRAGLPLIPQYGVSGYWIDFAAQHPDRPGQPILAIEADGAAYHSSATARDRDRLRQEHLERLGWSFHRIWSTDWFHRRDAEIERAVNAWHGAVKRVDQGSPAPVESVPAAEPAAPTTPERTGQKPSFSPGHQIGDYSPMTLRHLARWIASDTLLRTRDEMVAEMMNELGFKRRGKNVVAALERAIDEAQE